MAGANCPNRPSMMTRPAACISKTCAGHSTRPSTELSPKIRTTFVLFAELGLSYKEIAETQEIPIGTVMSRINAARGKLQQNLDWEKLKGLD